ncbi:hypothetical protein DJ66_0744 [Candidatus Liberibacter solanacearum]|uniref:Uncharacterized protein n=1 Tax=Candidatus Liberibacter solanacearum TaxID=556287 RepID=A0A0F4VKK3_9HYPH|nr:hypothetical protein DJ66_0744 [Candidatus Liberibacter solanacearum]
MGLTRFFLSKENTNKNEMHGHFFNIYRNYLENYFGFKG